MRTQTVLLALVMGCTSAAESPDSTFQAQDTETGSIEECRDQGESCNAWDDGTSDCCNGRHTCFPEGCFYTQPD